MDLKTFAVHRKLEADSPLLKYVMDGEAIPIPVVAENFREYLEPLTDRTATRLIEDYAGLIGDEIPVTTQRMEDGGYEISGEIPDRLVEAIQLVHSVTPEEIVSALVNHNTEMVHGQALAITNIDLTEAARKTLLGAASIPKVELVQERPEPDLFETRELPPVPIDPIKAGSETPVMETETPVAEMERLVMETGLPSMETETEVPMMEAMEEEPVPIQPEDPSDSLRAAVARIYRQFVADLKAYNLDQRLNLALN